MSIRIKTNGSLPRERRPQDFNGLLNGPTSPNGDLGAMFSFDNTYNSGINRHMVYLTCLFVDLKNQILPWKNYQIFRFEHLDT